MTVRPTVLVVTTILMTACSGKVSVSTKSNPPPQPIAADPAPPPEEVPPAEPPQEFTVEGTTCSGRPNVAKMKLSMKICSGAASRADLQDLHRMCRADRDGECHFRVHHALRVWDETRVNRAPFAAEICDVRAKEALLGLACAGSLANETLVDLVHRCRRNDPTCVKIAKASLASRGGAVTMAEPRRRRARPRPAAPEPATETPPPLPEPPPPSDDSGGVFEDRY